MIPKATITALTDPAIPKISYDKTIEAINAEVDTIWRYIIKASGRKLSWWAFRNDRDLGNGNGSTGGSFDPVKDKDYIDIKGDYSYISSDFYEYSNGFPTELLWDPDFKATVDSEIVKWKTDEAAHKLVIKAQKSSALTKKIALITSIKSKLTKEELKVIKFK